MSEKLNKFRIDNPSYSSLEEYPNGKLAFGLWNSEYKKINVPMGIFADSLGLSDEDFGQRIRYGKQEGYTPIESTFAEDEVPAGARFLTAVRGATLGAAENVGAGIAAGAEKVKNFVTGEEQRPYSEAFNDYLNLNRDIIAQYQKAKPVESFAVEAVPAIATGVGVEKAAATYLPKAVSKFGPASQIPKGSSPSIGKTAAYSGAGGGVYGFNTGESGERLENAYTLAIPSAIFGGGSQVLLNFAAPALRNIGSSLGASFKRFDENPTIQAAKRLKQNAYKAATNSGLIFDGSDFRNLYNNAKNNTDYDPKVTSDENLGAAINYLEQFTKRQYLNVMELDKIRRGLWSRFQISKRASSSNKGDPRIRDIISDIDDMIQTKGTGGDPTLITAARLANGRYRKAEEINNAFDSAGLTADATGGGGNLINKYKQAVKNILTNPRRLAFYTKEEQKAMRDFVSFTPSEQFVRMVAKLDPSASALSLMLQGTGVLAGQTTGVLATAAGGAVARRSLEQSTDEAAQGLVTRMATGQTEMVNPVNAPFTTGEQVTSQIDRDYERIRGN